MDLTFIKALTEFGTGAFMGLILIAFKHVAAKTFIWRLFWEDSLKPNLYAIGGGVIILTVFYFFPEYSPYIEIITGGEIEINHTRLLASGAVLAAVIKGYFKEKNTIK